MFILTIILILNVTVTLTYLEDNENAAQAYEQAISLESRDPNVCLNYAIFLHNTEQNDRARQMYNEFEARVVRFRQSTGADLEPEVSFIIFSKVRFSRFFYKKNGWLF